MAAQAALFINSIIGGITSYFKGQELSKEARARANALERNLEQLQGRIAEEDLNLEESLKRIDDFISSQSAAMQRIMNDQVNSAVRNLNEQYRQSLVTASRNIREQLGKQRLTGSGVGLEAVRGTGKQLLTETQERTKNLREQALATITGELSKLETQGFGLKEKARATSKLFKTSALDQIMQLQNMADAFGREAESHGFLDFLSGATAGGLGGLVSGFFTPGEELRETGGIKTGGPEID
jgi:hypothetical protein